MTDINKLFWSVISDFYNNLESEDRAILENIWGSYLTILNNLYLKLYQIDASKSLEHSPVLFMREWKKFRFDSTTYRRDVGGDFGLQYDINASIRDLESLQDLLYSPATTLAPDVDYKILADGIIGFKVDPPDIMWASRVWYDAKNLWYNFGTLLKLQGRSNQHYKDVLNTFWWAMFLGFNIFYVQRALTILFSCPYSTTNTSVLSVAGTVITMDDGTVYDVAPYNPTVSAGNIIFRYDPLSDAIRVFDFMSNPDWWDKEDIVKDTLKFDSFFFNEAFFDSDIYQKSSSWEVAVNEFSKWNSFIVLIKPDAIIGSVYADMNTVVGFLNRIRHKHVYYQIIIPDEIIDTIGGFEVCECKLTGEITDYLPQPMTLFDEFEFDSSYLEWLKFGEFFFDEDEFDKEHLEGYKLPFPKWHNDNFRIYNGDDNVYQIPYILFSDSMYDHTAWTETTDPGVVGTYMHVEESLQTLKSCMIDLTGGAPGVMRVTIDGDLPVGVLHSWTMGLDARSTGGISTITIYALDALSAVIDSTSAVVPASGILSRQTLTHAMPAAAVKYRLEISQEGVGSVIFSAVQFELGPATDYYNRESHNFISFDPERIVGQYAPNDWTFAKGANLAVDVFAVRNPVKQYRADLLSTTVIGQTFYIIKDSGVTDLNLPGKYLVLDIKFSYTNTASTSFNIIVEYAAGMTNTLLTTVVSQPLSSRRFIMTLPVGSDRVILYIGVVALALDASCSFSVEEVNLHMHGYSEKDEWFQQPMTLTWPAIDPGNDVYVDAVRTTVTEIEERYIKVADIQTIDKDNVEVRIPDLYVRFDSPVYDHDRNSFSLCQP